MKLSEEEFGIAVEMSQVTFQYYVKFQVVIVVSAKIAVLWVMTLSFVSRYHYFGGMCYLAVY